MLRNRLISGCALAAALALVTYGLPAAGIWLLIVAVSSFAQIEFYALVETAGVPVFRVVGLCCGAALISATFLTAGPLARDLGAACFWEQFVLLAAVLAVSIRQFPQKHSRQPLGTIACTLLGVWYVPFLLNFLTRLAFAWDGAEPARPVGVTGRLAVLYMVAVVKCTDIGAYFIGSRFGRHKLFPRISPKKSWEGLAGGIAAAVVVSLLFWRLGGAHLGAIRLPAGHAVALAVLLSAAGVAGDLFESLLKRAVGVKDSGSAIPGMGGLLDVLDSLLFGAPLMYVYARLFLT